MDSDVHNSEKSVPYGAVPPIPPVTSTTQTLSTLEEQLDAPMPLVDTIVGSEKLDVSHREPYPEAKLSKGRKIAISTFLILCNSTLVCCHDLWKDAMLTQADDVFRCRYERGF